MGSSHVVSTCTFTCCVSSSFPFINLCNSSYPVWFGHILQVEKWFLVFLALQTHTSVKPKVYDIKTCSSQVLGSEAARRSNFTPTSETWSSDPLFCLDELWLLFFCHFQRAQTQTVDGEKRWWFQVQQKPVCGQRGFSAETPWNTTNTSQLQPTPSALQTFKLKHLQSESQKHRRSSESRRHRCLCFFKGAVSHFWWSRPLC